jgi:hypothetical protein
MWIKKHVHHSFAPLDSLRGLGKSLMLMYSAEIRWFFEDNLPDTIENWFRRHPRCSDGETRVDEYLLVPGCETVNIKLRGKNFEVKALVTPPHVTKIGDVVGLADGWVKWSLGDPAVTRFAAAMRADVALASVHKTRFLVKCSFDTGAPQEVPADAHPVQGCNAEVTAIEFAGRPWWTIALEAFGSVASIERILLSAAARFFGDGSAPHRLDVEQSCSYAVWLARRAGARR